MPNLKLFKQQHAANRHRAVIVISGPWEYCFNTLIEHYQPQQQNWWLGELDNPNSLDAVVIDPQQAKHYLGRQCQQLIINAHSGIDLNAFGAVTGSLIAGGCCYILTPSFAHWPQQPDQQDQRFNAYITQLIDDKAKPNPQPNHLVSHLINTINIQTDIAHINSDINSDTPENIPIIKEQKETKFSHPIYLSAEQQQAVEKIIKVATGHRNRPLVLTADRGRGKSSALGLAASELIKTGKQNLIITAPQKSAVAPVFDRLSERQAAQQLEFIALDQLIANKPPASILFIDEAAAISAALLTQLVSHYSRVVLTSTINGYEGTGRSFEIRFKRKLAQIRPQWQQFHLVESIRFANNDPLETFCHKALMLDAQAAQINQPFNPLATQFSLWQQQQLQENPQILSQIIGLLALAHYKTSPNDIRHLLNGNNIDIATISADQQIIAVAMVATEGGFDHSLSEQIAQGQRRPRGHLLPQSLAAHSGIIDAPRYHYARIVRITVHPSMHQQGIGSQLLSKLALHYQNWGFDFICSSFGANQNLLRFWLLNQYVPVRLGLTLEASSNEYAAIVIKALKSSNQSFVEQANTRFYQQLQSQLIEFNSLLCPKVACLLLASNKPTTAISETQRQDLDYYLNFQREYEFCSSSLKHWLLWQIHLHLDIFVVLDNSSAQLLIAKVIAQQPWPKVIEQLNLKGKKDAANQLKQIITECKRSIDQQ